jgi:hypothetical protein
MPRTSEKTQNLGSFLWSIADSLRGDRLAAAAFGMAVVGRDVFFSNEWSRIYRSASPKTFLFRGFRVLPGAGLIVFGCWTLLILIRHVMGMQLPTP